MERTRSRVYPRSARLCAQVGCTRLAMAPGGLRDLLWRSLAIGPAGRLARPPAPVGVGAAPPGAPPQTSLRSLRALDRFRCRACPVSASIHDALSSAAPG